MTQADASNLESGLEFYNGTGGFANGGREYVTMVRDGKLHADAVDQCRRQSGFRLHHHRGRRRLCVVARTASAIR